MNLFILPSWLPHRCHPLEGTFLVEQASALAELHPDWNVGLSRWGQGLSRVSWAHARESPRCLASALLGRDARERDVRDNLVEFGSRALSWNESIAEGNAAGILSANRRNLTRAIRRFGRVDLLHAHVSYPAGWVACRLSEEFGIPYVITEHMGPFPLPVYARRPAWLERYVLAPLKTARARIAVSPALAESLRRFGIPEPEVVPNLIDERLYRLPTPEPARPFQFFTLGGMQAVKGFPDLLHAIARFLERLDDAERRRVRFTLAGYGPELADYQALARRLGVEPWLSWPGFLARDVARERFHGCDCYVLSSHYESFGIVLVEAMACGKPVIATRCGGPEALVDAESGILVDRGAPAELAEAMLAVFRGLRTWDGAAIRERALARFSRPAVVRQLERIYERVTLEHASPAPSVAVRSGS